MYSAALNVMKRSCICNLMIPPTKCFDIFSPDYYWGMLRRSGCIQIFLQTLPIKFNVCVYVCVFIKLHISAQSGPVILVILCHSH